MKKMIFWGVLLLLGTHASCSLRASKQKQPLGVQEKQAILLYQSTSCSPKYRKIRLATMKNKLMGKLSNFQAKPLALRTKQAVVARVGTVVQNNRTMYGYFGLAKKGICVRDVTFLSRSREYLVKNKGRFLDILKQAASPVAK